MEWWSDRLSSYRARSQDVPSGKNALWRILCASPMLFPLPLVAPGVRTIVLNYEWLCLTTVIGTHFRSAYVIHWGHHAPKVEVFGFWGGNPVFSLEAQGGPQVVAVGSLNASLSVSPHSDHLPYTSASWHHPGELEFIPGDPYQWSTIASWITLYRHIEQRQKIISLWFAVLKAWNPVQVEMCDLEWYETLKQK